MTDEAASIAQRLDNQEKALRELIDVIEALVRVLENDRGGSLDLRGFQGTLSEIKGRLRR